MINLGIQICLLIIGAGMAYIGCRQVALWWHVQDLEVQVKLLKAKVKNDE
jgi:hypothetical protein